MTGNNFNVIDGAVGKKQAVSPASARKRLLLALVLAVSLQFIPFANILLYPLRLFVTFVHESGHALAAIASGGMVQSLAVMPNGEGVTMAATPPFLSWLTFSSGYLGAALFGALLMQVGRLKHGNAGRLALGFAAISILVITFAWAFRPFTDPFTLVVSLGLSGSLLLLAKFLKPQFAQFFVAFLAAFCSLNALGDLHILLTLTQMGSAHNDAANMAKFYGGTPFLWALMWAMGAIVITGLSLHSFLKATGAGHTKSTPKPFSLSR